MCYQARFIEILDYIDAHLDEGLNIDHLSETIHLSKFHFHRLFTARFGISIAAYIKQLRFKRAAYLLAFRTHKKVIDIALLSGFESSEAFSRAFKKAIGQTPSEFRKRPEWQPWHEKYELINQLRNEKMKNEQELPLEIGRAHV